MTRRAKVLLALVAAAILGFVVVVFAVTPKPSEPDFSAANVSPTDTPSASPAVAVSVAPSASPSVVPVAAASDPCHRGAVTYCALNPAVTEATIRSTICVSGWTATIRPPTSYTEPLKLQQVASEGLSGGASNYEEDHRMPLELGGAPRDPTNLSPESHATSYAKDTAENAARREVCDGADLRTVQAAFVAAWLGPYPTYAK